MSNQVRRNGRPKKSNRSSKTRNEAGMASHPPPLQLAIVHDRVLRYIGPTGVGSTLSTLLRCATASAVGIQSALVVAISTTTVIPLFSSVRIKKIRMWGPPQGAGTTGLSGAPSTVSCSWVTGNGSTTPFGGSAKTEMDTSLGVSRGAFVSTKPPRGSLQSMWLESGSTATTIANLLGNSGTIVDIHMVFQNAMNDGVAVGSYTVVGPAVPGAIYAYFIDSASALVPVGAQAIS